MKTFDKILSGLDNNTLSLTTFQSNHTAGDLRDAVSKYESMLKPLNIRGKRVVLIVPAIEEFIPLFMAVNKLEGVTAPLSWQFRQEDLFNVLNSLDPHIIFTVNEHTGFDFAFAMQSWAESKGTQTLVYTSSDCISWEAHHFKGSEKSLEKETGDIICFSSGSTGTPKGLVFHEDVLDHSMYRIAEAMELKPTDNVLVYASTSAIFGNDAMNTVIKSGANLLVANEFDMLKIINLLKTSHCNKVATTPSIFKALYAFASKLNPAVLKNLELVCFVGEKIPDRFVSAFPFMSDCIFVSHFGSSETGSIANVYLEADSADLEYTPVTDVEVKSVDGELYIKTASTSLFKGYYGNPRLTQEAFEDGWYKMGDLVEFLDNKTFKIVGRKKDIIKKGGQQVVPSEVEQLLISIKEVKNAAIVGAPHNIYGEQVVAFVVAEGLRASDIRTYCAGKISSYKIPDKVIFIDEIPLNQGNKVDKLKLKSLLK